MSPKRLPMLVLAFSINASANSCPDLAGKFRQIEGGKNEVINTQSIKDRVTTFSWSGLPPLILDGKIHDATMWSGRCEGGSKIILDLSIPGAPKSITTLAKTTTGYYLLMDQTLIGSFKHE